MRVHPIESSRNTEPHAPGRVSPKASAVRACPAPPVMISYSQKDVVAGAAACRRLEARGLRCWMAPRDILPGQEWGAAIMLAISRARVMVMIFSSHSNHSPHVRREVERAVAHGLHVIPVRVEDVSMSPTLEYFISTLHWCDASRGPLCRHLDRLATDIETLLKARNTAADGTRSEGHSMSASSTMKSPGTRGRFRRRTRERD